MNWQAKIIDASEIDDQRKQSIVVIMIDERGNQVDSLKKDFYGDPDEIRGFVETWKINEMDKLVVNDRKLNVGDII